MEVRHRVAQRSYGGLRCAFDGLVVDGHVVRCPQQGSFWGSKEALQSSSMGSQIFVPLDCRKGYAVCSSGVHLRCHRPCSDGRRALLLRPQRRFPDGTAEGVQSEETLRLPLRHFGPRLHGTFTVNSVLLPPWYMHRASFLTFPSQVLVCGLLGIPPSNGVLPQSPMHTKSLAVLKRRIIRKKMVETAKESIRQQATNSEMYGKMQEVFVKMDEGSTSISIDKELKNLKDAVMGNGAGGDDSKGAFDPEKHIDAHLPVRVNEQRVTNLLQSLLVGACLAAMPVIKMIPTSVLWGYFAYMAIDSLPGNQFWERTLLLLITPSRRFKVLEGMHASFVESVPFRQIAAFTIFQFLYLLLCFGVTWIPVAGILFPLPFFVLLSIRQHVLPKFFHPHHLWELDAAEYDEIAGTPRRARSFSFKEGEASTSDSDDGRVEVCDAEILDELTTHRGELKHRNKSFNDDRFHQVTKDACIDQVSSSSNAS
ncbi:unnamed protein product, partial [Musa textilis]